MENSSLSWNLARASSWKQPKEKPKKKKQSKLQNCARLLNRVNAMQKTTINGNSPQALEQLPDMLATLIHIGNRRSIAGSCCSFCVGSEAQPSSCGRKPPWRSQGGFLTSLIVSKASNYVLIVKSFFSLFYFLLFYTYRLCLF